MSYLGRKGAVAPLTSADIPVGIVEGTDIAFLENASGTQNLGGTYSTERMYLNDSYTLTGDVTITGHLALGTVGDADVVITQDSTERTITGSGTLESGDLLHRGEETLTGMTGELGSAVTGSPALNLINATQFPSGHILQVQGHSKARVIGAGSENSTVISQSITLLDYVNNDVLIVINGIVSKNSSGGTGAHFGTYVEGGSLGSGTSGVLYAQQLLYQQGTSSEESVGITHWDKAPPSATNTYGLYLKGNDSGQTTHTQWSIAIYEIKR